MRILAILCLAIAVASAKSVDKAKSKRGIYGEQALTAHSISSLPLSSSGAYLSGPVQTYASGPALSSGVLTSYAAGAPAYSGALYSQSLPAYASQSLYANSIPAYSGLSASQLAQLSAGQIYAGQGQILSAPGAAIATPVATSIAGTGIGGSVISGPAIAGPAIAGQAVGIAHNDHVHVGYSQPIVSTQAVVNRHVHVQHRYAVPVDRPYQVPVVRNVPVPVPREVPVPQDQPYPVEVAVPVPVPQERAVPVKVEHEVRVPYDVPYKVEVSEPYPVHVEQPVPVEVKKDAPYPAPYDVPVHRRVPVLLRDSSPIHVGLLSSTSNSGSGDESHGHVAFDQLVPADQPLASSGILTQGAAILSAPGSTIVSGPAIIDGATFIQDGSGAANAAAANAAVNAAAANAAANAANSAAAASAAAAAAANSASSQFGGATLYSAGSLNGGLLSSGAELLRFTAADARPFSLSGYSSDLSGLTGYSTLGSGILSLPPAQLSAYGAPSYYKKRSASSKQDPKKKQ